MLPCTPSQPKPSSVLTPVLYFNSVLSAGRLFILFSTMATFFISFKLSQCTWPDSSGWSASARLKVRSTRGSCVCVCLYKAPCTYDCLLHIGKFHYGVLLQDLWNWPAYICSVTQCCDLPFRLLFCWWFAGLLELVMFTLYGHHYDPREEHLLLCTFEVWNKWKPVFSRVVLTTLCV